MFLKVSKREISLHFVTYCSVTPEMSPKNATRGGRHGTGRVDRWYSILIWYKWRMCACVLSTRKRVRYL